MKPRGPLTAAASALLLILATFCVSPREQVARLAPTNTLPTRLSDQEFWQLVEDMSEPGGYFRSDNLLSNEDTFQYVIPTSSGGCHLAASISAWARTRISRISKRSSRR